MCVKEFHSYARSIFGIRLPHTNSTPDCDAEDSSAGRWLPHTDPTPDRDAEAANAACWLDLDFGCRWNGDGLCTGRGIFDGQHG